MRNEARYIPTPGPHYGGPVPGARLDLKSLIGCYLRSAPKSKAVYVTSAQHKRLQHVSPVRFRNRDYPVKVVEPDAPLSRKQRAAGGREASPIPF